MRPHPQGVLPLSHLGSHADTQQQDRRRRGLGRLAALSDELLLRILHELDASTLAKLSCVSKALYCYSNHEELWRSAVLSADGHDTAGTADSESWQFDGSWKRTYVRSVGKDVPMPADIRVSGLFSDALYQPFLCSALDVDEAWLETENIDRRSSLSLEEFRTGMCFSSADAR